MSFAVVYRKECLDNFRDRRALISSLSLAVLGPALFIGLMGFMLNTAISEQSDPVPLTVLGARYAPALIDHLEANNAKLKTIEAGNPRELVAAGEEALILTIPADYADRFRAGRPLTLTLHYDSAKFGASNQNFARARALVHSYSRLIGALRLQVRGIDPSVVRPITVAESDVASPAARALLVLATLPYLMVLTVFMGGFYLAIDATAGEREHGSLEPLLLQPVSRASLVLAKIAAAATFSLLAIALFTIVFQLTLPLVPLERIGMALEPRPLSAVFVVLLALPLALMAAALLTLMASFAKSYKEAQTYLTFVILVPTLPLVASQLLNVETSTLVMLVPSLSQATLFTDLLVARPIDPLHPLLSALSTLALAGVLSWASVRLYRRERILL